jgi:hypothetical protein|tara:strand:+ start:75 stop:278 length:204 start_codon:yes stop_codon:yes gene_type:complete
MPNWKKVVVSGSSAHLNQITGSTLLNNSAVGSTHLTGSFTGSYVGDGSSLANVSDPNAVVFSIVFGG